jgi:hypothetical protein
LVQRCENALNLPAHRAVGDVSPLARPWGIRHLCDQELQGPHRGPALTANGASPGRRVGQRKVVEVHAAQLTGIGAQRPVIGVAGVRPPLEIAPPTNAAGEADRAGIDSEVLAQLHDRRT